MTRISRLRKGMEWNSLIAPPVGGRDGHNRYVDIIKPEYASAITRFFLQLRSGDKTFFLLDEIEAHLTAWLGKTEDLDETGKSAVERLFRGCQEILLIGEYTYAVLRPKIGVRRIVRFHPTHERFEHVSRYEYLGVKDTLVQGPQAAQEPSLIVNFSPYFQDYPKVKEPSEMGEGIAFMNRSLAGHMYQSPGHFRRQLLEFLVDCSLESRDLLLNGFIDSPEKLSSQLDEVRALLDEKDAKTSYHEIEHDMRVHGFEAGWGTDVETIQGRLSILARVLESPDPDRFANLLWRLPLIKTILMVSPHGWFAQDDVLGLPDTGGQVVYVLDQARALEKRMREHFDECGVEEIVPKVIILTRLIPDAQGTTCNVPRELVHGTENCWIVRVPYNDKHGQPIPHWISRFQTWPYLESFARRAKDPVISELGGVPDLIVGHYSDGNLVAHLMAEELDTLHCAAVHALEKTKYLFSDMHWADMEADYRFSLQYTADIIAYNSADFIITSSYREIGGSNTEMGMFESYETFTMPGLYRVLSGMDPQLARYNIVPPGASEEYFYPYLDHNRRVEAAKETLNELLYSEEPGSNCYGSLANPELPPVFAIARVDRLKNLSGLVELFGKSDYLREHSNLVLLSSIINAAESEDHEEYDEINKIHGLVQQHELDGHFRWIGRRLNKVETGEVYRMIADKKGVFAQPALMETFGLTIVEAMASGLPVVVTCFGGPAEIVIPGECGEVLNPNDHAAFAKALENVVSEEALWEKYSKGGIVRVKAPFNWPTHTKKLLGLANVYSYWNFLDVMNRNALDQYIHTLYFTVFRERANALLMER